MFGCYLGALNIINTEKTNVWLIFCVFFLEFVIVCCTRHEDFGQPIFLLSNLVLLSSTIMKMI